ncbi:DNA-binding protein [Acidaminobacter sp. JC074]|nr:DNA-binding protein [Acidaminobacter sp. JC074]
MLLYICIDDTDDLDSKGTGEIAEEIAGLLEDNDLGKASAISRHQLYVHEDIPYTSHNSSMCFEFKLKGDYNKLVSLASDYLKAESSPLSDPGLCIYTFKDKHDPLIDFGRSAKVKVLTKKMAYDFAKENNIYLNEFGGTGDGVIGALAGVGLRLTGNDGRFKGKHKIDEGFYPVEDLKAMLKVDEIMNHHTKSYLLEGSVYVSGKVKSVLIDHKRVLPVYLSEEGYKNCLKEHLRIY